MRETATSRVVVHLLGAFSAQRSSGPPLALPTRKAQALLAYLSLPPGRHHTRERLTALLWPDTAEPQARQSFRQALAALRRALGSDGVLPLVADAGTVTLDPNVVDVDVMAFERLARERDPEALARAAQLYRGDLLEGIQVGAEPFEEWLRSERERLRELALQVLARLLAYHLKADLVDTAIVTALRVLAMDPLQESVHRALMRVYARQGRRAAALRQYELCVQVLRRELGTEPETDTQRLYRDILQAGPGPAPARGTPEARGSAGSAGGIPLFGRRQEVDHLEGVREAAWAGRGRALLMVGEGGIGKTRLVEELASRAAAAGGVCLVGRFHAAEQVLALSGWVEALRAGGGLARAEHLDASERAELARVFPELGRPPRRQPGRAEEYLRLFQLVTDLLTGLCVTRPVFLVLEDLHWADLMSLRLLSFVARHVSGLPLLIVATAREEDLSDSPEHLAAIHELSGRVAWMPLAPLSETAVRELVTQLVGSRLPAEALHRLGDEVWRTSEGNPFVIVETVRALDAGRASGMPPSIQATVQARLDRLSPRARSLAAVAAVIGREFDVGLLREAARLSLAEVADALEELVRRRVLDATEEQFRFVHERVRDVVHQGLLAPRRAMLHGEVAAALAALHPDDLDQVSDRLAHHWSRAGDDARAVEFLLRLADAAGQRYALADSIRVLRGALGHADRLVGRARDRACLDVAIRLAQGLLYTGRVREAVQALVEHEPRVVRVGDDAVTARYYFWLGHAHSFLDEPARAIAHGERSLVSATRLGDRIAMGRANYVIARGCYRLSEYERGIGHARDAITLLEQTADGSWLGYAHWVLATNVGGRGDYLQALPIMARARELAEDAGDVRLQAYAEWGSSWAHLATCDFEKAAAACQRAVDLAPDPVHRAAALIYLGAAQAEGGEADAAIATLGSALQQLDDFTGFRYMSAYAQLNLSKAWLAAGNAGRAEQAGLLAVEEAVGAGWKLGQGRAERELGLALRAGGKSAEGEAWLHRSMRTLADGPAQPELAVTRMHLAEAVHERGDWAEAANHLGAALAEFRAHGLDRLAAGAERLEEAWAGAGRPGASA